MSNYTSEIVFEVGVIAYMKTRLLICASLMLHESCRLLDMTRVGITVTSVSALMVQER